jgi:hypothetical protein
MYIPLIVFFVFVVAGIAAFMYYTTSMNRAEARKRAGMN